MESVGEARREIVEDIRGAAEPRKEHKRRPISAEIEIVKMDVVVDSDQPTLRNMPGLSATGRTKHHCEED
jgi:hypothetical protein